MATRFLKKENSVSEREASEENNSEHSVFLFVYGFIGVLSTLALYSFIRVICYKLKALIDSYVRFAEDHTNTAVSEANAVPLVSSHRTVSKSGTLSPIEESSAHSSQGSSEPFWNFTSTSSEESLSPNSPEYSAVEDSSNFINSTEDATSISSTPECTLRFSSSSAFYSKNTFS